MQIKILIYIFLGTGFSVLSQSIGKGDPFAMTDDYTVAQSFDRPMVHLVKHKQTGLVALFDLAKGHLLSNFAPNAYISRLEGSKFSSHWIMRRGGAEYLMDRDFNLVLPIPGYHYVETSDRFIYEVDHAANKYECLVLENNKAVKLPYKFYMANRDRNLWVYEDAQKNYGLYDLNDNKIVVKAAYASFAKYSEDLFVVDKGSKKAIIDEEGKILFEGDFDSIEIESDYHILSHDGTYTVLDKSFNPLPNLGIIASMPRFSYTKLLSYVDDKHAYVYNVALKQQVLRRKAKDGISLGEEIVVYADDSVIYYNSSGQFSKGDSYVALKKKMTAIYDQFGAKGLELMDISSPCLVRKNGKYGLAYSDTIVLAPQYDMLMRGDGFWHRNSYYVSDGRKMGMVASEGRKRLPIIFDHLFSDYTASNYIARIGAYGLLDAEGRSVLPYAYESMVSVASHLFVVGHKGKYGLYHADQKNFILHMEYDMLVNDMKYLIGLKNGKYQRIEIVGGVPQFTEF